MSARHQPVPPSAEIDAAFRPGNADDTDAPTVGRIPASAPIMVRLRDEIAAAAAARDAGDPVRHLLDDVLAGRRPITAIGAEPSLAPPPREDHMDTRIAATVAAARRQREQAD